MKNNINELKLITFKDLSSKIEKKFFLSDKYNVYVGTKPQLKKKNIYSKIPRTYLKSYFEVYLKEHWRSFKSKSTRGLF